MSFFVLVCLNERGKKKRRVCGAPFFPRMDGGKSDGWNDDDDDGVASFVTVVVVVVYLEVGQ